MNDAFFKESQAADSVTLTKEEFHQFAALCASGLLLKANILMGEHASTQMIDVAFAQFYDNLDVVRGVVKRELGIGEYHEREKKSN